MLDMVENSRDCLGPKHEMISARLIGLGQLYRVQVTTYTRGVTIYGRCSYGAQDRLDKAEQACTEALQIQQMWGSSTHGPSLGVSQAMAEVGAVYQQLHRIPQAEQMLETALQIAQDNLAAYKAKNEGDKSHRLAAAAVADRKAALGVFYRQLGQVKARPQPLMVHTEARVDIVDFFSKAETLLVHAPAVHMP